MDGYNAKNKQHNSQANPIILAPKSYNFIIKNIKNIHRTLEWLRMSEC